MRRNKIRQTCKETRVIPIVDLPTVKDDSGAEQTATPAELQNMGIFEFDRGSSNVQAECVGYWCPDRKCGVDANGNGWPGTLMIAGGRGHYRKDRLPKIAKNLIAYKDGNNGGKRRLMDTPLDSESERALNLDDVEEIIPPVVLKDPENDRLKARLPRIMGDV